MVPFEMLAPKQNPYPLYDPRDGPRMRPVLDCLE